MFGRKKNNAPKRTEGGKALMAQMGFMTSIDDMVIGSPGDDEDDDLEAELRALQTEDTKNITSTKITKSNIKSAANLDQMIALSMKDIPCDEDVSDTDDPELLAELEGLMTDDEDDKSTLSDNRGSSSVASSSAVLQLLQDRTNNYKMAIDISKSAGDLTKTRRYERALKALDEMMKKAKSGKQISEEDIPPPVVNSSKSVQPPGISEPSKTSCSATIYVGNIDCEAKVPVIPKTSQQLLSPKKEIPLPVKSSPSPPQLLPRVVLPHNSTNEPPSKIKCPSPRSEEEPKISPTEKWGDQEKLSQLISQREIYKSEALKMKKTGNNEKAVEYMKCFKQFDAAVKAMEGNSLFTDELPPFFNSAGAPVSEVHRELKQGSSQAAVAISSNPAKDASDKEKSTNREAPATMLESLQSRLLKYNEAEKQAKEENNSGKVRRMGRIVKQYEEAIKMHKKGQPYDYNELPCPPGFPPLQDSSTSAPSSVQPAPSVQPESPKQKPPTQTAPPTQSAPPIQRQASMAHSRAEQQASFLEQRQMQFKKAALQAKSSGDLELAKKYMRMAKGFDQMIEASRSGLPVNLSQIPAPPDDESGFVFVDASEVPSDVSGDASEVYKKLQDDLINQIKLSDTNRDMFTKLGDISSANKFEKLREGSRNDLEALKNAFDHGDPVPRFHYETRHFSIVRCCPDLGDNDLEVTVVRGLNFNPPPGYGAADLNTYVKFEFPFPDIFQVGETPVFKATDSPEFNHTTKFEVNRKSRSFLRLLKSSKIFKFEVFYKRGFLKTDKPLGSIGIKLQPLEDKCIYHECYDLMEGRKAVGGKLEVKIRIRDPFVNKQVDETKERWLVIDDFIRKSQPQCPPISNYVPSSSKAVVLPSSSYNCISVLLYEKDILDQQINKHQSKLKPADVQALQQKSVLLQKTANNIKAELQKGGTKALQDYLIKLKALNQNYASEAKTQALQSATDKIKIILTKKTLVEKEIESVTKKLQVR